MLKNSTKYFTLPLVDNQGNTYTPKPGTVIVFNDTPELADIGFDAGTLIGQIRSKGTNGLFKYHFTAVSIKGAEVTGSDTVTIADVVPPDDANQVVALYQS